MLANATAASITSLTSFQNEASMIWASSSKTFWPHAYFSESTSFFFALPIMISFMADVPCAASILDMASQHATSGSTLASTNPETNLLRRLVNAVPMSAVAPVGGGVSPLVAPVTPAPTAGVTWLIWGETGRFGVTGSAFLIGARTALLMVNFFQSWI